MISFSGISPNTHGPIRQSRPAIQFQGNSDKPDNEKDHHTNNGAKTGGKATGYRIWAGALALLGLGAAVSIPKLQQLRAENGPDRVVLDSSENVVITMDVETIDRIIRNSATVYGSDSRASGMLIRDIKGDLYTLTTASAVSWHSREGLTVKPFGYTEHLKATVVNKSEELDLALLKIDAPVSETDKIVPSVNFQLSEASFHPYVVMVGGKEANGHFGFGKVRTPESCMSNHEYELVCSPGDEGSGVYDLQGRLVGMVQSSRADQGLCSGASSHQMADWLEEINFKLR